MPGVFLTGLKTQNPSIVSGSEHWRWTSCWMLTILYSSTTKLCRFVKLIHWENATDYLPTWAAVVKMVQAMQRRGTLTHYEQQFPDTDHTETLAHDALPTLSQQQSEPCLPFVWLTILYPCSSASESSRKWKVWRRVGKRKGSTQLCFTDWHTKRSFLYA